MERKTNMVEYKVYKIGPFTVKKRLDKPEKANQVKIHSVPVSGVLSVVKDTFKTRRSERFTIYLKDKTMIYEEIPVMVCHYCHRKIDHVKLEGAYCPFCDSVCVCHQCSPSSVPHKYQYRCRECGPPKS